MNTVDVEFKDKVVLLVDDSIVRGTTSKQIVQMARDAGAKKVYLASAAPPVRSPNIYGIDMPSVDELVAHGRTEKQIEELLGCDWLIYQELDALKRAVTKANPALTEFEASCFDGNYITGDVTVAYLSQVAGERDPERGKTYERADAKEELSLAGN